jgi:hypothetical protein
MDDSRIPNEQWEDISEEEALWEGLEVELVDVVVFLQIRNGKTARRGENVGARTSGLQ